MSDNNLLVGYQSFIESSERYLQNTSTTKNEKQLKPSLRIFLSEVIDGLKNAQKTLPCKYFYDEKGSQLFEQICQLEEYYITRTELSLIDEIKHDVAKLIGKNATIIEPGAGAGIKIRKLLNALDSPQDYVPMDISKEFLFYSSNIIQQNFPQINIMPIQGDFTQPIKWLSQDDANSNNIVFFPGSTIGNFEAKDAIQFLKNMKKLIGGNGAIIVGVDLIKDHRLLEQAYDDSKGITAAFNKNILKRINQQLNADFAIDQFDHEAIFNAHLQRIEMYLVSKIAQTVHINGQRIHFSEQETIHTENSHKYSDKSFLAIAAQASLNCIKKWHDKNNLFAIYYLTD